MYIWRPQNFRDFWPPPSPCPSLSKFRYPLFFRHHIWIIHGTFIKFEDARLSKYSVEPGTWLYKKGKNVNLAILSNDTVEERHFHVKFSSVQTHSQLMPNLMSKLALYPPSHCPHSSEFWVPPPSPCRGRHMYMAPNVKSRWERERERERKRERRIFGVRDWTSSTKYSTNYEFHLIKWRGPSGYDAIMRQIWFGSLRLEIGMTHFFASYQNWRLQWHKFTSAWNWSIQFSWRLKNRILPLSLTFLSTWIPVIKASPGLC